MVKPITLCTSQWVDIPLNKLVEKAKDWGLDGLELTCGGDHFNVSLALENGKLLKEKRSLLKRNSLN
ncbi:MAG: sugar phosphate isomerase/epimerase, partial [Thermodesulfobacteriota bacterium]|nr:sugar phosphate isomerase/epimerase [Thermodesulfobacteriota bacterium]